MKIAVVIPSFKCKQHILGVINGIPSFVEHIIVVDDFCPENTGKFVEESCHRVGVKVIYNSKNMGVGGAVISGYKAAMTLGAEIVVKLDGDGQMDASLIEKFVKPIESGYAQYTKGNRFTQPEDIILMPKVRIFGNLSLSFLNKLSSGYWKIMDPTNGFTAIHRSVLERLPLNKISQRYFFESDMLFRLGLLNAQIRDIPMKAVYGDEVSNLKIKAIFLDFLFKHIRNFYKRVLYKYFILEMNIGSIYILMGSSLFSFGLVYGAYHWIKAYLYQTITATGTIMVSALTIILGFQLIIGWLTYDIQREPHTGISFIE